MNTLLSSPRRLVVALVAAGALGATGAGLITAREVRAQAGMPAAAAPAPLSASVALPDFSQITARYGAAVVVMIGVSRVVLNVHNPSDVLAGWSLGYLYLLACVRWYPPRPALEAAVAAAPGTVTPAAGTPPAPDTST